MSDTATSSPKKSGKAGKIILGGLAGLFLLLVVVYFVGTSSGFIKSVVLPQVSAAAGGQVTAEEVSLSPFSSIRIRNFKLTTTGAEPLVTAAEAVVRYQLFSIIKGNIVVDEITLSSPQVHLVMNADGSSNLDPLLQKAKSSPKKTSKPSEPAQIDVRNIALKDGTVIVSQAAKDGSAKEVRITGLNITLDQLKNGQSGKLTVVSDLRITGTPAPASKGTNDLIQGKVSVNFALGLGADLSPKTVQGEAKLDVVQTAGAFKELAGLSASLQANLTPTQLEKVQLQLARGGAALGGVTISGPFDSSKMEGKFQIVVSAIDRSLLNLAGAAQGLDFGATTFTASSSLELTQQAKQLALIGKVSGQKISVRQGLVSTPTLDMDLDYDVAVNLAGQSALIRKLDVLTRQNQAVLVRGGLDQPMSLTWGGVSNSVPDATLKLTVTNFNLADWKAVGGTNLPNGKVGLTVGVRSSAGGKRVGLNLSGAVEDLGMMVGGKLVQQGRIKIDAEGTMTDFNVTDLTRFGVELSDRGLVMFQVVGSAKVDSKASTVDAQTQMEASLPELLQKYPVEGVKLTSGRLKANTKVAVRGDRRTVTGDLQLASLSGTSGGMVFRDFGAGADFGLVADPASAEIQKFALSLLDGQTPGGRIELSGRINLTNKSAQLTFKTTGLNQNGLQTFLAPSLGENKLVSINLDLNGTATSDPLGDSTIKGVVKLDNLVVAGKDGKNPSPTLGGSVEIDGAYGHEVLTLKQLLVSLTPTARAKNQLSMQGKVDLRKTNAVPSDIKILSEGLDVTHYYDLFSGSTNATAKAPAPPPTTGEPPAMQLPLQDLTAKLAIDRFYLRQIAITNLSADVAIQKGEITFKTAQILLNGAPVSATALVNVGVPGYKYDVSFDAAKVPVQPLADSFSTNTPGKYSGTMTAQAKIQGAGVTGAGLKNNLTGNFSALMTNMNLEVIGPKIRPLLTPIALVLRLQDLLQSPVDWVSAQGVMGKGAINVTSFGVASPAFYAEATGVVQLAEILTNSTLNLPVNFSLSRALAEKSSLLPSNTPTNAVYAALPAFVKLDGTLGAPKTEVDKMVISGMVLRSVGGIVPQIGGKAVGVVQGLGNFLTGEKPAAATTTINTNATVTGVLTNLAATALTNRAGLKTNALSQVTTNSAGVKSTNPPAKLSPLDLLRLLPQKKQQ